MPEFPRGNGKRVALSTIELDMALISYKAMPSLTATMALAAHAAGVAEAAYPKITVGYFPGGSTTQNACVGKTPNFQWEWDVTGEPCIT
eukprot:gene8675-7899_t